MTFKTFFSQRLCQLRKDANETQRQVASAAGISERHYQKMEAGETLPGFEKAVAIADHFGVSLDYLAGRSEEQEPRP